MSKQTAFAFLVVLSLLIVNRLLISNSQVEISNLKSDLFIAEMQISIYAAELDYSISAIEELKENQKYLGIDVATLTITRTSTIEEVDKIIKEAIDADNMEEDEYNSLVADTIMNMENNMQLIGDINAIQAELIKRQVIKELKKE